TGFSLCRWSRRCCAIRFTILSRATAIAGSASDRPASFPVPTCAIASSICEPAAVVHEPAGQRLTDPDIEAKTPVLFPLARFDARPQQARQWQAAASHAAHQEL